MKLLIPQYLAEERRVDAPTPLFGVYYGYGDIAGRKITPADLTQALAKYRRSDVIRWINAVALWVARENSLDPANQLAMVDVMLSESQRKGVRETVQRLRWTRWTVFHRRQLWFLLQMTLISGKEDAPATDEKTLREAVGECLLMATDIIQQIEPTNPIGEGPEEANKWMATQAIPLLDAKDRHEIVARAQSFWFELINEEKVKAKFTEMGAKSFEAAFADRYGLPLRDFFLVVFTLYIHVCAHSEQNGTPLLVEERNYLWPTFGEETVRRALALISQTPDELALKLFSSPRQNWAMDYTPLREIPVLQVFEGKHACPDLGLLHRCLTDKIYFLLNDAYPEKAFGQLFGYIFEAHVNRVIRRFAYDSDLLFRQFYAAPRFSGKEQEAGDAILRWERTALVMEYKARLLTTREKYCGLQDVTLAGIDDIVGKEKAKKGVYQLAKVIGRLLAGEKVTAGSPKELDLKTCPRIYPVLVTYEQSVGLEAVRQQAEAKFSAALGGDWIKQGRVGPLLILTVREIEILDHLALTMKIEGVIREYAAYVVDHPKDRAGSFLSFVINRGYGKTPSGGRSFVDETYRSALDGIIADIGQRTTARTAAAGQVAPAA